MEGEEGSTVKTIRQVKSNLAAPAGPFICRITKAGIEDIGEFETEQSPQTSTPINEVRPPESRIGRMKLEALDLTKRGNSRKEIRAELKLKYNAFDAELSNSIKWAEETLGIVRAKP
jgi:hypothetical protein